MREKRWRWDGLSQRMLAALLCVLLLAPGLAACATVLSPTGEVIGSAANEQPDDAWPRQLTDGNETFSIFQPQYERWGQGRLDGRSAVAVEDQASPEPRYGVIWFTARTQVDKETRLVTLEELTISKADFPTAPDGGAGYRAALQRSLTDSPLTIALDRLQGRARGRAGGEPRSDRSGPKRSPADHRESGARAARARGWAARPPLGRGHVASSGDQHAGPAPARPVGGPVLLVADGSVARGLDARRPLGACERPAALTRCGQADGGPGRAGGSPRQRTSRSLAVAPGRIHPDHLREHHPGRASRGERPAGFRAGVRYRHSGGGELRRRPLPVLAGAGLLRAALGSVVPRHVPRGPLAVRERRSAAAGLRPHPRERSEGGGARLRSRDAAGAGSRDRQ
jgi:hypothetical protein